MNSILLVLKASLLVLCGTIALPAQALLISEVHYDAVGLDNGKVFVELWGEAGFVLDGYVLEGVNGSNGAVAPILALSGTIPADGFFVVADMASSLTLVPNADLLLEFDFQNGPDSIVLRDLLSEVVDAIGYGVFGPSEIFAGEGSPAADPAAGWSLARLFANADSNDNAVDFAPLEIPTPGVGPIELPEPGSAFLLGGGFFALLGLRRVTTSPLATR